MEEDGIRREGRGKDEIGTRREGREESGKGQAIPNYIGKTTKYGNEDE